MTEPQTTPGTVTPEERKLIEESGWKSRLDAIVESERQRADAKVAALLKDYEAPDPSQAVDLVPAEPKARVAYGTGARLGLPTDVLYGRMSPLEREWRSPDSDHWVAEWIRGMVQAPNGGVGFDMGRIQRAEAELDLLYPHLRADTLLGVSGPDGDFPSGTGGTLVPRPLENIILIERDRVAKMRRFANPLTMTTQKHNVPTAASMTAGMVGEQEVAPQGEPTLSQVPLIAKDGQVQARASWNMVADAAINLVNTYAVRAGGALGVLEDDQFYADGDGVGNNISAALLGSAYTLATPATFSHDDASGMYFAVPQVYRSSGIWQVASDVLEGLTAAKAADGRPFYVSLVETPAAVVDDPGQQGTLMRRPVYEVPLPAGTIYFGDVRANYTVGTRAGITADVSREHLFTTRTIIWLWTQRFDGNNVDTVAGAQATGITTVAP